MAASQDTSFVARRPYTTAGVAVGVLLATPLTIVMIVLVQTLYVEDVLGNDVALLGEH